MVDLQMTSSGKTVLRWSVSFEPGIVRRIRGNDLSGAMRSLKGLHRQAKHEQKAHEHDDTARNQTRANSRPIDIQDCRLLCDG